MKKTKIVCTIGPSTDDDNVLREMMKSGMDVARFNFSHSEHEVHQKRFEQVCRLRDELGLNIATLLDTKGPEVRLRSFKQGSVVIKDGEQFTLTTRDVEGDETVCSITFANLPKDVSVGTAILIDDGAIELCAQSGAVCIDRKDLHLPLSSFGFLKKIRRFHIAEFFHYFSSAATFTTSRPL